MVSAISSAISGLNAAITQINVSAQNIANQQSTTQKVSGQTTNQTYHPQQFDQVSLSNGGVQAQATQSQVNASDPAKDLVQLSIASCDAKANTKAIEAAQKQFQNLIDITS